MQVALLLIRHGADLDMEDKEGYTVLGRASDELRPLLIDAAKAMLEGWHDDHPGTADLGLAATHYCQKYYLVWLKFQV